MTEPKKYRRDWTIEPAYNVYNQEAFQIQYYKHSIDMDNVHYCSTVEEAESEIDDAIIMEQEQVIEKFREALRESTEMMIEGEFSWSRVGLVMKQIEENQRMIKSYDL